MLSKNTNVASASDETRSHFSGEEDRGPPRNTGLPPRYVPSTAAAGRGPHTRAARSAPCISSSAARLPRAG
eukprot:scaffold52377_cov72-Phaeocystis_antarctica.AAC.10